MTVFREIITVSEEETRVIADFAADTAEEMEETVEINGRKLAQGSQCWVISEGEKYGLDSSGNWCRINFSGNGGGGGSGGTTNYNALTNKPKINGNTLSGEKTFEELGLVPITDEELSAMWN